MGHDAEAVASSANASPARGALVAALDDWAGLRRDAVRREWLRQAARRADPDAWRDRVREAGVGDDPARPAELARTRPVFEQPASGLVALAERLQAAGGDATGLLSRVQAAHPDDFWANFALGNALEEKGDLEAAVACYRKAPTIRPEAFAAYLNIGHARALCDKMDMPDGAVENDVRALKIEPRSAVAHNNLGFAWKNQGQLGVAIDEYRKALEIDPELVRPIATSARYWRSAGT